MRAANQASSIWLRQPVEHFASSALASRLDRAADAELQLGHHVAAEQLAHKAAELREALS